MVHLLDDVNVERFEGGKLLLFKLKFREPIPHGRQFSVTGPQVVYVSPDTLTIGNYFAVDVHWGDGTRTLNAPQGSDLEHTYASAGTYIIVISGSIEKADDFSITGATEI